MMQIFYKTINISAMMISLSLFVLSAILLFSSCAASFTDRGLELRFRDQEHVEASQYYLEQALRAYEYWQQTRTKEEVEPDWVKEVRKLIDEFDNRLENDGA